jgi:diguanylate cyclase (GGDEF)-like protein
MYGGDHSAAFDAARQALHGGQAPQARALATALLSQAKSAGDLLTQARAFHLLARIEHQHADLSAALSLARQSAHLLHVLNITLEESAALSHVAHLSTLLGLTEEAVESATLSVRLVDALPPGMHTVDAYNYLGVASIAVDAAHADKVLCKAVALAQDLLAPQAAVRPMSNRLFNELYRLELCRQQALPTVVRPVIQEELARYTALLDERHGLRADTTPFGAAMLRATLHTARAGLLAHSGAFDAALDAAEQIDLDAIPLWMQGFVHFVRARCQLAAGHWQAALATTHHTLTIAAAQGQIPFTLLSHYQRMEAFEALGDTGQMLREFRAFRAHQLQQQAETLISRERVAALRLAWREQTRAMEVLHSSTRALEQLTREDPLTGLANRRALELCLDDLLSQHPNQPAVPWCLVMLDIDGFKQINDRYSHVLGDHVLRQMGQLLREVVRTQDLAVRLAGDEFVLILRDTTEAVGQQVIDRLATAIDQHPWITLQSGLAVRVSIGLAQALDGDTSTSLLLRSDMRMYADKADKLARHFSRTAPLSPPAPD